MIVAALTIQGRILQVCAPVGLERPLRAICSNASRDAGNRGLDFTPCKDYDFVPDDRWKTPRKTFLVIDPIPCG